jgi:hypothetical protein
MTKLRDVLSAADPVRHEPAPADDQRARLRHTIVAAASKADARPGQVRRMRAAAILAFASIAIATIVAFMIVPRGTSTVQAAVRFEVRLAEDEPAAGLQAARVGSSTRVVYLHPEVVVTNADIAGSRVIAGDTPAHFWIDVRLNETGADKMRRATLGHLGRLVAILIDGDVVATPRIRSPIGAAAMISGDFTRADAERIAQGMTLNQ